MRRLICCIILFIVFCSAAYAHPGGTDSKGGHTNRSTGEYHYHHGYSAHQHPDGECPYDFDDKTGASSGSSSGKSSNSTYKPSAASRPSSTPRPTSESISRKVNHAFDWKKVLGIVFLVVIVIFSPVTMFVYCLFAIALKWLKDHKVLIRKILRVILWTMAVAAVTAAIFFALQAYDFELSIYWYIDIILIAIALGICIGSIYLLYKMFTAAFAFLRDNKWTIPFLIMFIVAIVVCVWLIPFYKM